MAGEVGNLANSTKESFKVVETVSVRVQVESINTMGEVHHKRSDVIKSTVLINKDIANNISMEMIH